MQSFDSSNQPVSKIVPVDTFEEIIEELKKPNVEYVKVFIYKGLPSIEKQTTETGTLTDSLDLFEEVVDVDVNALHGKAQREALRR